MNPLYCKCKKYYKAGGAFLKPKSPANKDEIITEEEEVALENDFIDTYLKNKKSPIFLLFKLYARYAKYFAISMFFYLIKQSPVIVMPIIVSNIINEVVYRSDYTFRNIVVNLVVIATLIAINVPTNALYVKFYSKATRRVEAGLRGAMVRKLQQLSITFHKEMQSGRIQSKLMRDVETVHTFSTQIITSVPAILINMITALCIVITKDLSVFFFFLLCIPCDVLLIKVFGKTIKKKNNEFRRGMESTSASLMDMEEMTQITRAHALEETEMKKTASLLKNIAKSGFKLDMVQAYFGSFTWVTIQVFQLACLVFSAWKAYQGEILIGDINLFQSYFNSLIGQVSSLIGLLPIISKGLESVSSIGEILGATDIEDNRHKMKINSLRGEYEFKNVSFSYDSEQHLISNLNLKVKVGETIAIVGPSGSGKSTIINLAIGFIHAQSGEILVDGNNIEDINLRSYRQHIAIVPQSSVLFTGTIRANITYGLDTVNDEQLERVLKAARLYDFIKTLPNGVDTMLDEHGENLSGGQKQRISIARAIIRNPSVIIFDEATSALDTVSEKAIQDAINDMTKGKTTFIVAHRLSTIRNANRIAVLKNGRCVEIGTYEELMALHGEFYEMQTASEVRPI